MYHDVLPISKATRFASLPNMMDREAGFYTGRCLFAVIIMYQQLLPFTSTENSVVALYLHLYYYERSKFLIVDEGKIVRKKTCAVAVHGAITGQSNP